MENMNSLVLSLTTKLNEIDDSGNSDTDAEIQINIDSFIYDEVDDLYYATWYYYQIVL